MRLDSTLLKIVKEATETLTAESVFKKDSLLPVPLQNGLFEAISSQKPGMQVVSFEEIDTKIELEASEDGIMSYYFSSTFQVTYESSAQGFVSYLVMTESRQYDIKNNSGTHQILKVQSLRSIG